MNFKHGMNCRPNRTPEYRAWEGMKRRCKEKKTKDKKNYADRGISVCERWENSFVLFLQDVGMRPGPGYTLDRKDNDKGYEPGNVRWATYQEQNNNRRNNKKFEFNGQSKTLSQWANELGGSENTIRERLKRGIPLAIALTKPIAKRAKRVAKNHPHGAAATDSRSHKGRSCSNGKISNRF